MKYFEIDEPYYAMIKADDEDSAKQEYVKTIADNEGEELVVNEVGREYAFTRFIGTLSDGGEHIPLNELLEDFKSDEAMTLIVDGSLL